MSTRVRIPTPLRSYTGGAAALSADGASVREILDALDADHPGIRFRVVDEQGRLRRHLRVFVNDEMAALDTGVAEDDEVTIVLALSGG